MTHSLGLTIITFVFIAGMLAFLATPVQCAEIYTSANSNYPSHFDNSQHNHYFDVLQLDAVYFAGKEIVFFTMDSDYDTGARGYLYYYTPGFSSSHDPRISS